MSNLPKAILGLGFFGIALDCLSVCFRCVVVTLKALPSGREPMIPFNPVRSCQCNSLKTVFGLLIIRGSAKNAA